MILFRFEIDIMTEHHLPVTFARFDIRNSNKSNSELEKQEFLELHVVFGLSSLIQMVLHILGLGLLYFFKELSFKYPERNLMASLRAQIYNQSHYREVPWWEIFMEQELRFGLDLGQLAVLKKRV